MKYRLLHIIAGMNPEQGGVCQAVRTMITELSKIDIQNEVVCLDDPHASYLNESFYPIFALGPGKSSWCYTSKPIPWLLENLMRFDAVIVHGLWLYHGYAVRKSIKILRSRNRRNKIEGKLPGIFVMPHGMLDPYFQDSPGRLLKSLRNKVFWKVIEKNIVNEADGLLFTSEEELRLARQPFKPYNPKRESVVGLGVEESPLFSFTMKNAFLEKCPELKNSAYLLFLGRIDKKKGVDLLIEAYTLLVKKTNRKNSDIPKLVIAGPGLNTEFGQKMLQMAYGLKEMQSRIFFPGMLAGDAKWGAYHGCEAFILPSHQENFGIAVVEALACGKPVLISNQINIWREIIQENGGISAEDSLKGTQELLDRWNKLGSLDKQKMGKQSRRAFENYFSTEIAAKKLTETLFSDITVK